MEKILKVEYHTEEGLEHFIGLAGYDNIKVTELPEEEYYFCQYVNCGKPNLGDSNYCREHSQWMLGAVLENIQEKNKRVEKQRETCRKINNCNVPVCTELFLYHSECFKPKPESEFCECKTNWGGKVSKDKKGQWEKFTRCCRCSKQLKPKKKLEKLSEIEHPLAVVNQLRDKINEIIERINENPNL